MTIKILLSVQKGETAMAINLIRGAYGFAILSAGYLGVRDVWMTPGLSNEASILKAGEGDHGSVEFVENLAQKLGMKKTVVLIQGNKFGSFGCHAFSPKIGMEVMLDKLKSHPLMSQIWITHHLAHIHSNDILTWSFVPLVMSIFTAVLLNPRFPSAASLAGLAIMGISYLVLSKWREVQAYRVAFEYCSKEANEAAEKHFEAKIIANLTLPALGRLRNFFYQLTQPSPQTLLLYCRARLRVMR